MLNSLSLIMQMFDFSPHTTSSFASSFLRLWKNVTQKKNCSLSSHTTKCLHNTITEYSHCLNEQFLRWKTRFNLHKLPLNFIQSSERQAIFFCVVDWWWGGVGLLIKIEENSIITLIHHIHHLMLIILGIINKIMRNVLTMMIRKSSRNEKSETKV
jgi:hypothetical protein